MTDRHVPAVASISPAADTGLAAMPLEFTAFCELHRPRYLSFARVWFHEPGTAGRVVDQAFRTLAQVWPEVLGSSNPTAIAWQILRSTVAECERPNSEPLAEHRPAPADEDLAILHYVVGLAAPEIADVVGAETASVAGQLRHALRRMPQEW